MRIKKMPQLNTNFFSKFGSFNYTYVRISAIILPSIPIYNEVMDFKHECQTEYLWDWHLKSKPHITLSNFIQPLYWEEKIVNNYERLSSMIAPFPMSLSGFGNFATHTIFVNIEESEHINELIDGIKLFTKTIFKKVPKLPPRVISKIHLTIAKNISEQEFKKAWPTWNLREYHAEFEANRLRLLRRPLSNIWLNYEVVGDFPFKGSGALNPQLKMF